jgi:hypothetical protein
VNDTCDEANFKPPDSLLIGVGLGRLETKPQHISEGKIRSNHKTSDGLLEDRKLLIKRIAAMRPMLQAAHTARK